MKRAFGSLALACLLAGTLPASARRPVPDQAPVAPDTWAAGRVPRAPGVFVASRDAASGTPTMVLTGREPAPVALAGVVPATRARFFLRRHAALWKLPAAVVEAAEVRGVHTLRGGATLVTFRQRVDGVPVAGRELKVLTDAAGRLVAMSGSLHPAAGPRGLAKHGAWTLGAEDAAAAALARHAGVSVGARDLVLVDVRGDRRRFDLPGAAPTGLALPEPVNAQRVLYPVGDRLVPAWSVELLVEKNGTADAARYVIAAADGRLLARRGLTFNDAFTYRVWADPTSKWPADGPAADYSPHATGVNDGSAPAFVPSSLVTVEGLNKNPAGMADPWLPAGATETNGNNVDAYADHGSPDGLSDGEVRAAVTAPGTFDHVYDTALDPLASPTQIMGAITQIFYLNNWLHDWWYDSGFDEASGNAQQDNYGRGGEAGDPLHAEAQDAATAGQRNNANMSAMSDGTSPRMQMYLWDGAETRTLSIAGITLNDGTNSASFGPSNFDVTGTVALVDDAMGASVTDACEDIVNDVSGKIALLDRGSCTFVSKVQRAEAAGAIGVILVNNQPTGAPGMSGTGTVSIPVLSVSQADGEAIKTALANGALTATLQRETEVDRDGTIDNQIVAHEWGHYIHNRLVDCVTQQCGAQGEGWGDFVALMMTVQEGDDLHGVYAMAGYSTATMGDSYYFGIRRVPYSVSFEKNALTFKHISDAESLPAGHPIAPVGAAQNSEVHNAGEVWATMMFEGLVALLEESQGATPRYTFEEARRRMGDYVVGGMKLAPSGPTFTEQRDAILATAAAADIEDFVVLAKAFARRGAGTGAKSPPADSSDFIGVVESFEVKGDLAFVSALVDDGPVSCDDDGLLDQNETAEMQVTVTNPGVEKLVGTTVKLSSTSADISFPDGDTVTLGDLGPFETQTARIALSLSGTAAPGTVKLTYEAANPASATPLLTGSLDLRVHYDNLLDASASDDVESDIVVWSEASGGGAPVDVWERAAEASGNHLWHGADPGGEADEALVSPALIVGDAAPFKVTFAHRYTFEQSDGGGGLTNWDGAVIEISADDGATWVDVADAGVTPGYGGVITDQSGNPLAGKNAFVGQSASWPASETVTLDFGSAYAGKTVRLRFRIGADQAVGDEGWFIDDIAVEGITNTPFAKAKDEGVGCGHGPSANAGADIVAAPKAIVRLDGRASSDPDMDELTFSWSQIDGPPVTIEAASTSWPRVVTPDAPDGTQLTFQLTVSDGNETSTDTVVLTVRSDAINPEGGDGGGCGCHAGRRDGTTASGVALLGLLLVSAPILRRRRRS